MRVANTISWKGLLAVALWGGSFVLTRVALQSFAPFGLVAVRLMTGSTFLILMLRLRRRAILPRREDRPSCLLLGGILSAHLLVQAIGLQYTSAIHSGWIIGFCPVPIALGAHLLRKQRIHGLGWLGMLTGTGGILVVTLSFNPDFSQARFGDVLQIFSCFTWTAYTLISVNVIAGSGALRVTAAADGVATIIIVSIAPFMGWFHGAPSWNAWSAAMALGVLCSGLAYVLWSQAVVEQGPSRTGSLLYLEPFFTLSAAVFLIGESFTSSVVLGGLCVLCGVWLLAQGTHIHPNQTPLQMDKPHASS